MSKFKKLLDVYNEKYKDLPDDEEELLKYVMNKYNVSEDKLTKALEIIDGI